MSFLFSGWVKLSAELFIGTIRTTIIGLYHVSAHVIYPRSLPGWKVEIIPRSIVSGFCKGFPFGNEYNLNAETHCTLGWLKQHSNKSVTG